MQPYAAVQRGENGTWQRLLGIRQRYHEFGNIGTPDVWAPGIDLLGYMGQQRLRGLSHLCYRHHRNSGFTMWVFPMMPEELAL